MRRLLLLLLFSLPLGAQVTITGSTIFTGASGGTCSDCALTDAANIFTQTNTFPAITVNGGVNGLPVYENTGLFNIGLGVDSTPTTATGIQNLGIGDGTLQLLTSGFDNTSIGVASNGAVTTGYRNSAIGNFALTYNVTGEGNTGIGSLALQQALGNENVGIGVYSLSTMVTGNGNVAIGGYSGCGTLCSSAPGSINNISNGIYIGWQAGASANAVSNQILIGYNIQSSTSNYMQLGNSTIVASTIYGVPTFPALGGSGSGCVGVSNTGLTSVVTCGSGGGGPTFQVNGTGLISSTTVNFENSAATNGLTLTFTNPSAGNVQLGFTGTLTNAGLANSSLTLNSQTVSLGGSGNIPFQTNSVNNASLAGINFETSTTNASGLTVTPSNPSTNVQKFEITGVANTAAALSGTPTLCSTGNAPTGILANGNATGCAAIGGGGGGGPTIQVNTTNTSNQSLLNFVNTSTVLFTNPSGGVVSATVPTSATGTLGVASPDNTTISAATGVYSIKSPAASTLLGFNASNAYTGFTLGTGLAFSGSSLTNTGMTGSLTANCIPKASTTTVLTCSSATDNGTLFSISDSGGLQLTGGSFPGAMSLATGTGSLPTQAANSVGEVGPLTGGTSYYIQHPNTAVAGFEEWSAPTTLYTANVEQTKLVSPEFNFAATTFAAGNYAAGVPIGVLLAVNAGHVASLSGLYAQGTCTTPPVIKICDITSSVCSANLTLTTSTTPAKLTSPAVPYASGDTLEIEIATAASGCTGGNHTISAELATP
jgi:hypothetical protein